MDEIAFYYVRNDKKVYIVDSIEFRPVKAGKRTELLLYAENKIRYSVDVEITVDDVDVTVEPPKFTVKVKEIHEFKLILTPKTIRMNPINTMLEIKLNYIIR